MKLQPTLAGHLTCINFKNWVFKIWCSANVGGMCPAYANVGKHIELTLAGPCLPTFLGHLIWKLKFLEYAIHIIIFIIKCSANVKIT